MRNFCSQTLPKALPRDRSRVLPASHVRIRGIPFSQALPKIVPSSLVSPLGPQIAEAEIKLEKKRFRQVDGVLEKGDTLYSSLLDKKIKKSTIHTIIEHLRPIVPFSTIMPGDTFVVTLDPEENLHRFEYSTGPVETYIVERGSDGKLDSFRKKVELEKYWVSLSGQDEGLSLSIHHGGE